MAKGTFASVVLLLGASLTCAAQPLTGDAGCDTLAHLVHSSVSAAVQDHRMQGAGQPGGSSQRRDLIESIGGTQHICSNTAAVASKAFSEAMDGLDFRISWNRERIAPGDYCLSHDIAECYPSGDPFSPLPSNRDFAFVYKTWRGITDALVAQMPFGTGGNLVHFSNRSLAAALTSELSAVARPATQIRGQVTGGVSPCRDCGRSR